jgi:hypothetical protein
VHDGAALPDILSGEYTQPLFSPGSAAVPPPVPRLSDTPFPIRLFTGIPRLDRFFAGGFTGGQITLLEGPAEFILDLTSRFTVNGVAAFERPVMLIDGGNTADPYGFATACRRAHLDARAVLARIFIARAFTVYQLDTLLSQLVEERIAFLEPAVLIISSLNTMYLDPDVKWDEAYVIFQNDLKMLRELTERYNVVTLITNHSSHKSYHALELARTLRAAVGQHIEVRARSKYKLRLIKNGSDVMDYQPLPRYQCSLDEFCPGGVIDG